MKIGDLVRPISLPEAVRSDYWIGLIIDFDFRDPIVYWTEEFNSEIEYRDQLEVIDE